MSLFIRYCVQKDNNMKQKIITLSCFYLVILFSVFVYYKDLTNKLSKQNIEYENDVENIKNKYLQQIDAIEYTFPDSAFLSDPNGKEYSIRQLVDTPRIGLYIESMQCQSCREDDLKYLDYICEKLELTAKPIVLCDKYSQREMKLLQEKVSYPLYKIEKSASVLEPLIKFNMPFFFLIDNRGVVSSAFFLSRNLPKDIGEMYFKIVKKRCQGVDVTVEETDSKLNADDLAVLNPAVDLGEVRLRTKTKVDFKVKNKSEKKCVVLNTSTSCSCIVLDILPSIILPGETETFTINYVASTNGRFNQTFRLYTNFQKRPYELRITGVVK